MAPFDAIPTEAVIVILHAPSSLQVFGTIDRWVETFVVAILYHSRNEAHFIGAASKGSRAGVVRDGDGNIIREAPLPIWANLRRKALNLAIAERNKKTDLNVAFELERSKHRRVTTLTFSIK